MKINWLILLREIIAVYSANEKKPINRPTFWGQNAKLMNVEVRIYHCALKGQCFLQFWKQKKSLRRTWLVSDWCDSWADGKRWMRRLVMINGTNFAESLFLPHTELKASGLFCTRCQFRPSLSFNWSFFYHHKSYQELTWTTVQCAPSSMGIRPSLNGAKH
jgi:hypothetical protein